MTPFQIIEAEMIKRGERIDALETENATLEKLVNELEARKDRLRDEGFKLHDYALELEEQVELLESLLRQAREEAAFWQNEAEK